MRASVPSARPRVSPPGMRAAYRVSPPAYACQSPIGTSQVLSQPAADTGADSRCSHRVLVPASTVPEPGCIKSTEARVHSASVQGVFPEYGHASQCKRTVLSPRMRARVQGTLPAYEASYNVSRKGVS
eukprot:gene10812-4994_t